MIIKGKILTEQGMVSIEFLEVGMKIIDKNNRLVEVLSIKKDRSKINLVFGNGAVFQLIQFLIRYMEKILLKMYHEIKPCL